MNVEHAYSTAHAAFQRYELIWWGGICGFFLLTLFFLLRSRRKIKEQAAELEKLANRLQKARKLEFIGMMAGEVAHDLNNILSGVLHYPEQILRNLPEDSPLRPGLVSLRHSGQQAAVLVTDLLNAAKAGSAVKEITDLNKLIKKTLESEDVRDLFAKRPGIILRAQLYPTPLPVSCSPPHIRQCLQNLLLNACDTINTVGSTGTVTVFLDSKHLTASSPAYSNGTPGEYALLSIVDTGKSMSPVNRTHIFEPFYSKKFLKRGGSGIGLAIIPNIMEEHEGWVDLANTEALLSNTEQDSEQGNRFDLYFPTHSGQHIFSGKESCKEERSKKGQPVLLISPDKEIQDRVVNGMTRCGYRTMSVAEGTGAISYLNRHTVDLVILDLGGDQLMAGPELYEQILFLHPTQKTLVICTNPDSRSVKEVQQRGEVVLLQALFNQEQLQKALDEALLSSSGK
ncbi:MAG: response regulator [Candidatus Electrothrix sp. ATG2]|nr:response regulator [Candidatus Electrothrix sp. ATG2]